MKHQKSRSSAKNCDSPLSRLFLNYIKGRDGFTLTLLQKTWQLANFSTELHNATHHLKTLLSERLAQFLREVGTSRTSFKFLTIREDIFPRFGPTMSPKWRGWTVKGWVEPCLFAKKFLGKTEWKWYLTPQKICPSHSGHWKVVGFATLRWLCFGFHELLHVVIWLHVAPIPSNFGTESPDMIYPRRDSLWRRNSWGKSLQGGSTKVTGGFMMVVSEGFVSMTM